METCLLELGITPAADKRIATSQNTLKQKVSVTVTILPKGRSQEYKASLLSPGPVSYPLDHTAHLPPVIYRTKDRAMLIGLEIQPVSGICQSTGKRALENYIGKRCPTESETQYTM